MPSGEMCECASFVQYVPLQWSVGSFSPRGAAFAPSDGDSMLIIVSDEVLKDCITGTSSSP